MRNLYTSIIIWFDHQPCCAFTIIHNKHSIKHLLYFLKKILYAPAWQQFIPFVSFHYMAYNQIFKYRIFYLINLKIITNSPHHLFYECT